MQASDLQSILKHYPEISGVHPACLAVPPMDEDDRVQLYAAIETNGLLNDITLTEDGLLLDGRNRLMACFAGAVEPRFKKVAADPWRFAYEQNIARRHLGVGQKAIFGAYWKAHETTEAKKRQAHGQTAPGRTLPVMLPGASDARDKAGARVGVGGSAIDKAVTILKNAPDIANQIAAGAITLESGYKECRARESQKATQPADSPTEPAKETTVIITSKGIVSEIALPKKVVFNRSTNAVDWARWTWNPVTGCEHGCAFCYAREIAYSSRMADVYPNKFEPTFHEYRLAAPRNTRVPDSDDDRDGRVFVCSMADLFGKWVPDKWIRKVFEACSQTPEWEYLFLTKWPARYAKMPLIPRAWYGASVIQQSDVSRVESAMQQFAEADVVRWISLEPMLQHIEFSDLSWCNLVVIGAQTATTQPTGVVPEMAPEFEWVADVVMQCRDAGVPYYLKDNLGVIRPGMVLPKGKPS